MTALQQSFTQYTVYYYCVYLFVLVGGDGDELSLFEGDVGDQTMTRADAHDVELRFILMERVQHDLRRERETCLHVLFYIYTQYPHLCVFSTLYTVCIHVHIHLYHLYVSISLCTCLSVFVLHCIYS